MPLLADARPLVRGMEAEQDSTLLVASKARPVLCMQACDFLSRAVETKGRPLHHAFLPLPCSSTLGSRKRG